MGCLRADPEKVQWLMDSIAEIGLQVPIDVLEVDGQYYGFSGCHRYEVRRLLQIIASPASMQPSTPPLKAALL